MEDKIQTSNIIYKDPMERLNSLEDEVIDNILKIARIGTAEDNVKLKANQILLNKLRPDKTHREIEITSQAPFELLMRVIREEHLINVSSPSPAVIDVTPEKLE